MAEPTLYERVGGIYPVAAAAGDHFSDQLIKNPKVVQSSDELRTWHTETYRTGCRG